MSAKDKNGTDLKDDNVLFDGKIYWRKGYNEPTNEHYLLSCEKGYEHDLSKASEMEIIGTYNEKEHAHLFVCD